MPQLATTMYDERLEPKRAEEKIPAGEVDHGIEVVPGQYLPHHVRHDAGHAYYFQPQHQPPPPEKKICGLRRSTFILAIILAIVIIGGSVGGGVGGSLAVAEARKRAQEEALSISPSTGPTTVTATVSPTASAQATSGSATTATSSPTTSSRLSVPTTGLLALDCPSLTGTTSSVTVGDETFRFDLNCGVDNNAANIDIAALVAYSLRDCLMACASHNSKGGSDACAGVQFHADLTDLVERFSGNCFLKKNKGTAVIDTNPSNFNLHVSGMLRT